MATCFKEMDSTLVDSHDKKGKDYSERFYLLPGKIRIRISKTSQKKQLFYHKCRIS